MSKKLFTRVVPVMAIASALGLSMLAGCSMTEDNKANEPGGVVDEMIVDDSTNVNGADEGKVMSEDEAKAIVFKDAGVAEADASNVKVEKKTEGGVEVYDVEFDANGVSYDYVIDAKTGALIEYDEEATVIVGPSAQGNSSSSNSGSVGSTGSTGSGSSK